MMKKMLVVVMGVMLMVIVIKSKTDLAPSNKDGGRGVSTFQAS